jgi:hypothetical protein
METLYILAARGARHTNTMSLEQFHDSLREAWPTLSEFTQDAIRRELAEPHALSSHGAQELWAEIRAEFPVGIPA